LPLFGNIVPYLRGMILKELIQKYEFDDIVPDLLTIDEPVQDNLYAFKEAFDELRRMAPGDAGGKQIIVIIAKRHRPSVIEETIMTPRYLEALQYLWRRPRN